MREVGTGFFADGGPASLSTPSVSYGFIAAGSNAVAGRVAEMGQKTCNNAGFPLYSAIRAAASKPVQRKIHTKFLQKT